MESPHVVIIAGPNGAGKSTAAPKLLRDYLGISEFVNADVIAQGMSGFDPAGVAIQAGRVMLARLHELAQQRISFALETTLAAKSYANWLRELRSNGYQSHLQFLWLPSPDAAIARVADRVSRGGHSVPEETIRRRYVLGLRNLCRIYMPLVDTWTVFDNSEPHGYEIVAMQIRGEPIAVVVPHIWNSIQEYNS